ncbi:ATP-binding protein [Streptomyces sp. NWU339]|nr:ATP-binding protein [Streptomyces sp. NWU339]
MASVIPPAPLETDAAASPSGPGPAPGAADAAGAAAQRRFRFELAAHPGSPAQARRLTRARLTGWSVGADTCDTAALVVSELVTNAIVHTAGSHIVCELHDGDDLVRIAVQDEGCGPDQPRANTRRQPEDEHGRGLLLVDAMSHAWGVREHGPGLLVWADLPRKADRARPPDEPHDDLGWGERPKPDPADGSDGGPDGPDVEESHEESQQRHHTAAAPRPAASTMPAAAPHAHQREYVPAPRPGLDGGRM